MSEKSGAREDGLPSQHPSIVACLHLVQQRRSQLAARQCSGSPPLVAAGAVWISDPSMLLVEQRGIAGPASCASGHFFHLLHCIPLSLGQPQLNPRIYSAALAALQHYRRVTLISS
jgi:hypothetical protein